MELRNINTFLHVAELHSFSQAARELDYSQSAVSSQIAQLEEELTVPLFDRVGKTVRLTDAGQTFLHYARTLLTTAQQAKAALQPAPEASGTLRGGHRGQPVQRPDAAPAGAFPRFVPAGGSQPAHRHHPGNAGPAHGQPRRPGLYL